MWSASILSFIQGRWTCARECRVEGVMKDKIVGNGEGEGEEKVQEGRERRMGANPHFPVLENLS